MLTRIMMKIIHNDSAKWLNQGKQSTGYRFWNYCFGVHWVQE